MNGGQESGFDDILMNGHTTIAWGYTHNNLHPPMGLFWAEQK